MLKPLPLLMMIFGFVVALSGILLFIRLNNQIIQANEDKRILKLLFMPTLLVNLASLILSLSAIFSNEGKLLSIRMVEAVICSGFWSIFFLISLVLLWLNQKARSHPIARHQLKLWMEGKEEADDADDEKK